MNNNETFYNLFHHNEHFPEYEKSKNLSKTTPYRPFSQLTPPQRRSLLLDAVQDSNLEIVKALTQQGYVDPRYKKNRALRLAIELDRHDIIHHLMAITNTEKKWPAYDRIARKFGHSDIQTRFCEDFHKREIYWQREIFDNPNKIWA